MRIVRAETDYLIFQKMLKQVMNERSTLMVWQVTQAGGNRTICSSFIQDCEFDLNRIHIKLNRPDKLQAGSPLYCYAEKGQFIFKSELVEAGPTVLVITPPVELKLLEDKESTEIRKSVGLGISTFWKTKRLGNTPDNLGHDVLKVKSMSQRSTRDQDRLAQEFQESLEEEDKFYADKRESPRARPNVDKWVKVMKTDADGPSLYKLFDLSRGGMAFVVYAEFEFPKASDVYIVGFDEFDLDDALVGRVMSIRPLDETMSTFKVGVKFSEGQD